MPNDSFERRDAWKGALLKCIQRELAGSALNAYTVRTNDIEIMVEPLLDDGSVQIRLIEVAVGLPNANIAVPGLDARWEAETPEAVTIRVVDAVKRMRKDPIFRMLHNPDGT